MQFGQNFSFEMRDVPVGLFEGQTDRHRIACRANQRTEGAIGEDGGPKRRVQHGNNSWSSQSKTVIIHFAPGLLAGRGKSFKFAEGYFDSLRWRKGYGVPASAAGGC